MGYDDAWEKSVLPHGELEELASGLWWVWAPCPGAPVARNMSVYELPDGGLLVHSAICLNEEQMAKLDARGDVRFILVPNEGHRIDVKRFKKRYPKAAVIAPESARRKVEDVIAVDQSCEEALPPHGIRVHRPAGMKDGYELVYEVDLKDGGRALLINDILAAPHPHGPTGFGGFMGKILGPPGARLGQPRIVRFIFGKDRGAFRGFVRELAQIEDVRVIVTSHGGPVTEAPTAQLTESLGRL